MTIQLSHGSTILSKSPAWRDSFEAPHAERVRRYADPGARARLVEEGGRLKGAMRTLWVKRGRVDSTRACEGRTVAEIADERGQDFIETMLDLALEDDLQTEFSLSGFLHSEEDAVATLLKHPAVHIGSGDAGAHISQFSGAGDTCYLLERFVRERGDLALEEAVRRLTSELATHWGMADRGVIREGAYADLVVFDPATISRGEEAWVEDVPGGHGRYVRRPAGVDRVIVNGEILVASGSYTGRQPGRLL